MLLADEHTGVVDGLGQALLEHQGLQPSLQHIIGTQGEGVIQLVLGLVQQTVLVQPAHEGLALENALGVLLVVLQQGAGCITDLGQHHLWGGEEGGRERTGWGEEGGVQ